VIVARYFHAGSAGWFGLAVAALLGLSSVSVVGEAEQAVVLRMGEPDRVINRFKPDGAEARSGAGLAFHVPLIESVAKLPRGLLTLTSAGQTVHTTDMQGLVLDTAVTVRVIDPVRLAGKSGSAERINAEIQAWLPGLLKAELGQLDSGQVQLTGSSGAIARIRTALDTRLRASGVQVIDLRFERAVLPVGAQQETMLAMGDRREALAGEERNRGAREVQLITSEAEAEAASILQASAGRDPEFYDFYRAMKSYEAVLAHPDRKDKATIVLPPDSGYLRQFNTR
jgi:modulator of FtsH protease HflC